MPQFPRRLPDCPAELWPECVHDGMDPTSESLCRIGVIRGIAKVRRHGLENAANTLETNDERLAFVPTHENGGFEETYGRPHGTAMDPILKFVE